LQDTLSVTNPTQPVLRFLVNPQVVSTRLYSFNLDYESDLELYGVELQHIWERAEHRWIVGGRYQAGELDTFNALPGTNAISGIIPPTREWTSAHLERLGCYAYYHWTPLPSLRLLGGLSYEHVRFPANFRTPPLSEEEDTKDALSPKAGLLWSPFSDTTVRAAYTRSLGGVTLEQSYQLEPSQIAGFVQNYRSIIPEAAAGPASAPSDQSIGLALDQKLPTRTYLGLAGEWLESKVTRQNGVYLVTFPAPAVIGSTPEKLDFRELTFSTTINQLLGEEFALGAAYRVSLADLQDRFTQVPLTAPATGGFLPRQHQEALLHQVHLTFSWTKADGWFALFDAVFSSQDNREDLSQLDGDDFWQFNVAAGYRFPRRRAEVSVGLLNLTDQDYRLHPLNLIPELPRERTLALRLRLAF